jgi:hypothetical protein
MIFSMNIISPASPPPHLNVCVEIMCQASKDTADENLPKARTDPSVALDASLIIANFYFNGLIHHFNFTFPAKLIQVRAFQGKKLTWV